jgi:hypothetical protein
MSRGARTPAVRCFLNEPMVDEGKAQALKSYSIVRADRDNVGSKVNSNPRKARTETAFE